MVRDYRDLEVWRLAMDLAEATYRLVRSFPQSEVYRRASRRDDARFIGIARRPLAGTETLLILARRTDSTEPEAIDPVPVLADRVGRMLNGLHRSLTSPHYPTLSPHLSQ